MSKSKKKKNRTKRTVEEAFSFGPIQIERAGETVRYSKTGTAEEQSQFLKQLEESHKKLYPELEQRIQQLQALIQKYDPIELMHRATYMLFPILMKYKSESDFGAGDSKIMPGAEYVQYLIARTKPSSNPEELTEAGWGELWELVIQVLDLTSTFLITRKPSSDHPDHVNDLQFLLDSRRLLERIDRYAYFYRDHLSASLLPYAEGIQELFSVSADDIIDGIMQIRDYQSRGVFAKYAELRNQQQRLMEELYDEGFTVDPSASDEEVEKTRIALQSDRFKKQREEVEVILGQAMTPELFDITDLTPLPKSILSLLSVRPGESELYTLTGAHHDDLSPLSTSVLQYKPFLEVDGHFYTAYHSGLVDRIAEIFESELFNRLPAKISTMAKRRSNYLETESRELLAAILKPDFSFLNAYYPNPDEEGGLTELDALIGVDDILFLVEAKAGGLSEGFIRGAPLSLEGDITDLIIEGQRQSVRAERYINSLKAAPFFEEDGKTILYTIKRSDFRQIYRIIITREELGWIGAKLSVLTGMDGTLEKSYPWHISIDDLRVVSELFTNKPITFVHYLEQRKLAAANQVLTQNDELDHIGLYHDMNLYQDIGVGTDATQVFMVGYTNEIDHYFHDKMAGENPEVPGQTIPPKFQNLLAALGDTPISGRFLVGTLLLSNGGEGRIDIDTALTELDNALADGRRLSYRMTFAHESIGLTITYAGNNHLKTELLRSAAQMQQSQMGKWLVVQLRPVSPYRIKAIETVYPDQFTTEELASSIKRADEQLATRLSEKKIGRNERCPCGSGKKYKRCHGR